MAAVLTAKGTQTSKAGGILTMTLASVAISDGASVLVSVAWQIALANLTGITWNGAALAQVVTKASSNGQASIWALHGATGGTGDVVATFDNTGFTAAMAVDQVVGLTASPNDKTASATGTSTTPSSGATATTSQAAEIWCGAIGTCGPSGDTVGTWTGTLAANQRAGTTGGTASLNSTISTGFVVAAVTSTPAASKTGITSREWDACVATFKSAADQSVSLGVASSATAGYGPSADAGTASVALTTATPASAAFAPSVSAGAISVALGTATAATAGYAPAVTGDASVALGTCSLASDVPVVVSGNVLDNQAPAVQSADPPTTQFDPVPSRVAGASSSGIRSNGSAYFALWMQNLVGFTDIGGGEETCEILFALHAAPQQYASPSEPHWLVSFQEVGGSELFSIGVTPDLRLCAATYGRPVLMTAPGTVQPDGVVRDVMLFSPGGGSRQLYLDGVRVAQDFVDNGAAIGLFSPSGQQCRAMLFNGLSGLTRCDCSIFAFGFYTENDNIVWPLNESHGVTANGFESDDVAGSPIIPPTDLNFPAADWHLTADWFDPFPNPRTWPVSVGDVKAAFKWLRGTRYRPTTIVQPTFTELTASGGPFAPVEGP